uniref:(northern house mosquito) hypothetical protein n=1 Tax=Culex pipiens TaxID=7175 RepID=A0A8D8LG51_CULPI
MRLFVTIAAALLCPVVLGAESEQIATFKSFEEAAYDCAPYYLLDDSTVRRFLANPEHPSGCGDSRLARCVLIDLVAWDDEAGIKENVIWQFFEPYRCNDYAERTRECIAGLRIQDVNERAQESLRCYLHHYGKLIPSKKYFVPLPDSGLLQLKRDDYLLAGTPWHVLEEVAEGNFSREYELAKALFIGAVRGGFLDFSTKEFYMDRVYTQFTFPSLLSEEAARCQAKVTREFHTNDPIALVFEKIKRCLEVYQPLLDLLKESAAQLVAKKPKGCGGKSSGCGCHSCCAERNDAYYPRPHY